MKQPILTIIILFLLASCGEKKKSSELEKLETKTNVNEPTQTSLKKEKLFLDFYSGIGHDEYQKIAEKLVSENKLEKRNYIDFYYNYKSDCKVKIEPIFENEILTKVVLKDADCIYPVYKEKYNLPELIEKPHIDYSWIENNPDYDPKYSYKTELGATIVLPDAFRDESQSLPPTERIKIDPKTDNLFGMKKFMLQNPPLVVKNGKTVIYINQEITKDLSTQTHYSYSLDNSKKLQAYRLTTKGKKGLDPLFGKENQFIQTNSKLRRADKTSTCRIDIAYMLREDYEKMELEIRQKEKTELENKKSFEENKKERLNSVKDEI